MKTSRCFGSLILLSCVLQGCSYYYIGFSATESSYTHEDQLVPVAGAYNHLACQTEVTKLAYWIRVRQGDLSAAIQDGHPLNLMPRKVGSSIKDAAATTFIKWTNEGEAVVRASRFRGGYSQCSVQMSEEFPFDDEFYVCSLDDKNENCRPYRTKGRVVLNKMKLAWGDQHVIDIQGSNHGIEVSPLSEEIYAVLNIEEVTKLGAKCGGASGNVRFLALAWPGATNAGYLAQGDGVNYGACESTNAIAYAAWSPNGLWLAYTARETEPRRQPWDPVFPHPRLKLLRWNQAWTGNNRPTNGDGRPVYESFGAVLAHNSSLMTWSPDSRSIYFATHEGGPNELVAIRIADDGSASSAVLVGKGKLDVNRYGMKAYPEPSPDGAFLAFAAGRTMIPTVQGGVGFVGDPGKPWQIFVTDSRDPNAKLVPVLSDSFLPNRVRFIIYPHWH